MNVSALVNFVSIVLIGALSVIGLSYIAFKNGQQISTSFRIFLCAILLIASDLFLMLNAGQFLFTPDQVSLQIITIQCYTACLSLLIWLFSIQYWVMSIRLQWAQTR